MHDSMLFTSLTFRFTQGGCGCAWHGRVTDLFPGTSVAAGKGGGEAETACGILES
jgi:hypothetical protein